MEYSLKYLLSPLSLDEFRSKFYTKKSIHLKGSVEKFSGLFSFSDLNQILNTSQIPHPTLKVVKDGSPILGLNFNSIIEACKNGASLIVDDLHKYNTMVSKLASSISHSLSEPIQVNMYLGQPDVKGFNNHYDCHDVFIVQTEGFKRWRVFEPTINFPLFHQKFHGKTPPEIAYLDCVLSPGDLLYIPRGHWHEAIAATKPSLHLTVGINVKTGIDFLSWLTDELRDSEFFRRPLPLLYSKDKDTYDSSTQLSEYLLKFKKNLIEKLTAERTINDFFKFYVSKEYHYEPFNLPFQFQNEPIKLTDNSTLIRNSFQSFVIESSSDTFELITSGKVIKLKNVCKSFVNFLMTNDNIRCAEITFEDFSITQVQAEQVVDCLVKEGIIKFYDN